MSFQENIQLNLYDSRIIFDVQNLPPSTYTKRLQIAGNAIRSTLWVKSIDVGATVTVTYWDFGPGDGTIASEKIVIASHPVASTVGSSRILVKNIHNRPRIEVVVSGGSAEFGIYASVVPDQLFEFPEEALDNLTQQVLKATDKQVVYTWLDFGDKRNERISKITYSSVSVGHTVSRDFSYTLVGNDYRLDLELWSIT